MSEEEKQMFNKMIYCNLINGEQALKFNRKYEDLQQKVEQLEKENEELKYLVDDSNIIKAFIAEHNKAEQLENIRKEAIKLIEEDILGKKIENVNWDYDECDYSDMPVERVKPLLSILNKGSNKDE